MYVCSSHSWDLGRKQTPDPKAKQGWEAAWVAERQTGTRGIVGCADGVRMPGLRRDPRTGPGGEQRAEEGDPSESGSHDFPREAHQPLRPASPSPDPLFNHALPHLTVPSLTSIRLYSSHTQHGFPNCPN